MNNIIKRTWKQNTIVNIEDLRGMTFQAESGAHTFEISAVDADNNPITLSGTPSGTMLRPDNTDQALTCSISGGKLYATLPAGCYDVPGRAGITIFLTSDSQKTALYAAVVSVTRTQSGTAAPGTTASVVDLINAINAAISQIPASDANLKAAMAPTYSGTALYSVGQCAWDGGVLYECTVPITEAENPRVAAHWKTADLSESIRSLRSALTDMIDVTYSENLTNPALTYGATINETTGAIQSPNNYYNCSAKIPCSPGETIYIYYNYNNGMYVRKSNYDKVAFYKSNGTFISIDYNKDSYTVPAEAAYLVQQGYKSMMELGTVAVFKKSTDQLGTKWISYSETKKLDYSYTPPQVISDIDDLEENAVNLVLGENLIDPANAVFESNGGSNLTTDYIDINPNRKYTLSYSGAADIGIQCYIKQYDEDKEYLGDSVQVTFPFKAGAVSFVTEADAVYIKISVYKSGGITPEQFPFSNPCLVYGPTKAIEYVPYKTEIGVEKIPLIPERLYTNKFDALISLAHMGLSYYFPQNTKWSWLGAKKAGFDYIECDLQVTASDDIVIIHDPDMRRYGGTAQQTVESLTTAQLQEFDAGAWFDPKYTGTKFPVFDDFVGFAKALGMKLALDCKTINTPERIDAVADILEKWEMIDNVIWITGQFGSVWGRVPNAKIMWATSGTLVNGDYSEIEDGWFAGLGEPIPADKWFCVDQSIAVADTYGLSDLQQTAELCRKYNCKYGLYAIDDNDDMYDYITSIPYLHAITSNRITPQAAVCQKFDIGLSNRPQDLKD